MTFLLVGHGGSYNRGCEAIVRSTLLMIRKEFKNVKVILSAFDYINEKNVDFGPNVQVIPAFSSGMWKRFTHDWFIRQVYRVFNRERIWELEYSPIIPYLKKCDAVISIGGDNYTLDYDYPEYFLKLNMLIKNFKKKIIIWGASIGPFLNDKKSEELILSLKDIDLITIREGASFEYLKSLGIERNVKLVADPAFILPQSSVLIENDNLDINTNTQVLGFNISPLLVKYNKNVITESVSFLNKVIIEKRMFVLLIPHVTQQASSNNDYDFMKRIYDDLKNTNSIQLISSKYNAMQMKYIISKCRLFIGARTHATIAALSSGIPTISIGYSQKSKGINGDIFDNDEYLINIQLFSSDLLFDKFLNLTEHYNEVKNILTIKTPELQKKSWDNVQHLKTLINN